MNIFPVEQTLVASPLRDIEAEVGKQLARLGRPPQGPVAITAGSRGIANIAKITKAAGDWLRAHGAQPFLVPCMGSHNGGTAGGQRAMIESLGLTEEAMGMEIRASMDVVKVGSVSSGDVWMDRHCHEAAGVLVLNRVKLHTCFSGPVQSGLVKMMVVGMGKTPSAETFHSSPTTQMKRMLLEMGAEVVASGKIWGGLAILEDGYDDTAELHAVPAGEILAREPELCKRHREYFPSLPLDEFAVLIVEEIGKTYSGTGMDTNVIGRRGVHGGEDLERPRIGTIAALSLAPASKGNAIGVGLADFISLRLREAIDEKKTFLNTYTTGEMRRMAIPCTLPTDEDVIRAIRDRYGSLRWLLIPNTLHLEKLFCSEDLVEELAGGGRCTVSRTPIPLTFDNGRMNIFPRRK